MHASIRVKTSSVLEAKWRVSVELLNDEDKSAAQAEHVFETMFSVQYEHVQTALGQLDFSLGPSEKLAKLAKFRLAVEQAPDNADVTIDAVAAGGYVVEMGSSPHEVSPATELASFEGGLEFNKEIPVGLKVGERIIGDREYFAVGVESVKFVKNNRQVEASLRVKTSSVLNAKWRAKVELITADGRVLAHSEAVLATLLRILGRPGFAGAYLNFSLGRWSDVSEAAKFRISVERAPEDAEVTAHLRR